MPPSNGNVTVHFTYSEEESELLAMSLTEKHGCSHLSTARVDADDALKPTYLSILASALHNIKDNREDFVHISGTKARESMFFVSNNTRLLCGKAECQCPGYYMSNGLTVSLPVSLWRKISPGRTR